MKIFSLILLTVSMLFATVQLAHIMTGDQDWKWWLLQG